MCSQKSKTKKKISRSKMAAKEEPPLEIIEIDDYPTPSSPIDLSGTPLRPVFCLKNREEIEKFEDEEDCFILEFDPYDDDDLNLSKANLNKDFDDADLCLISEKGQVACRDYPHPRHTCAEFPFGKTPHDSHCKLCYCYVCDSAAPCSKWAGSSGHCHAFNNEAWDIEKRAARKISVKAM